MQKKANAINKQFLSVYTEEDVSTLPDLGASPYNSIITEDITVDGVARLLADIQNHKAHGPDEIPARLLRGH